MEKRTITGVKKREQIQKANKTMFLWVIAASAAVAVCIVLSQFLIRQMMFNQDIISKKWTANDNLVHNIETFEEIRTEINKLITNERLTALRVAETDTALQVIIDALPTSDDRAALATSLQQVVLARSGVSIDSISVTNQGAAVLAEDETASVLTDGPQEIMFDLVLVGNYDQIRGAIKDMELSIRPFSVTRIQIEGSGAQLRAALTAKTFYLPAKTMEVQKEAVKP